MNQPPPLVDYNLFEADAPLREALEREGAAWAQDLVQDLGRLAGTQEAIDWGFQANSNPPLLRTHGLEPNHLSNVVLVGGPTVMPSLGVNRNVMCYLDSIFVYLRARSDGAIGRGRPENHEPKPDAFSKAEDACMG